MRLIIILHRPFNAKLKDVGSRSNAQTCLRGIWKDSRYITPFLCTITYMCRHNMPPEAFRSQYSQHSTSAASSPSRGSISAPLMGQPSTVAAPSLPQPSGAMSIGSIIEPNMRSEYASHAASGLHELSHAPIGTGPCSFAPELLYGLSPSMESPLYSSSDSCYSPLSDYLQPPAVPQQYYSQDIIQRPQSASLESCFQPIVHSPMSAEVATPSWSQYDPTSLGYGQVQETACLPPVSSLNYGLCLNDSLRSYFSILDSNFTLLPGQEPMACHLTR